MTENGERDKKAQGRGHGRVDICCAARRPTRELYYEGYTIQQGNQECTGERNAESIISSVVALLLGHSRY